MRTQRGAAPLAGDFERGLERGGAAAIVAAAGLRPTGAVEVRRVVRRSGRWVAADLRVPGTAGRSSTLVALASRGALPDGVPPLPADELAACGAWRDLDGVQVGAFPLVADPRLPGLATACNRARLSEALGARVVEVQRRRYRHLHRAVLRARLADDRLVWVKVVRPARVAALAEQHDRIGGVLACPRVLLRDEDLGLVGLSHLPGVELRTVVREPTAPADHHWPGASDVLDVSERLAALRSPSASRRHTPLAAVERHAEVLRGVLPEADDRIGRLAATLLRHEPARRWPGGTTVHGDLHVAQLVCAPRRSVAADRQPLGLLDLDDAGAGDPLDDRCRLVGHLVGTVESTPTPHGRALLAGLVAALDLAGDDDARLRVTAVLLGQALGPHRASREGWRPHALHRLRTAERWAAGDTALRPRR